MRLQDVPPNPRKWYRNGLRPYTEFRKNLLTQTLNIEVSVLDEPIDDYASNVADRPRIHSAGMSNHAASAGGLVSSGAAGSVKWKVAPRPPSPFAQIRPPCDSTIDLLIAKPMPLP